MQESREDHLIGENIQIETDKLRGRVDFAFINSKSDGPLQRQF